MRSLRRIIFLFACVSLCAGKLPKTRKKPHIVFMVVDDLGWNDVSFHGSKQIPTPNIDAIARDGVILNQYYVQPSCSPSRGSLMTGKYPIRLGFQHEVIRATQPWGLPLKEKILPQYLKAMKYATHAVGKWHLGFYKEDYLPMKRGFDSFFGYYTGVKDYYDHFADAGNFTGLDLHEGDKNVWKYNGTYATELFTAKAKKVIFEHNPSKPLFLYFAQQAPHSGKFNPNPIQVPDKYVAPLVGIDDEKRRKYAGMVSAMDYSVGEIFEALQKARMLDDTIFIFNSDNGGAVEASDGVRGSNWPLKGTKYNLWEGGTRVVSFVWSPMLRHKSRIYNDLMHISDWLPTLLSAAGGPDALKMLGEIDGVDQWPSLTHVHPSPRQEILLNIDDVEDVEGIRKGRYKLVKKSYYQGNFDVWYDKEGLPIKDGVVPIDSPIKLKMYKKNYLRYLKRSKAARVLWRKYGKDPRFAYSCQTPACKQLLEVKCGTPRPVVDTCQPTKGPCLFDVIRDPCEFYNIVEQLPEVVADLEKSLDKYRPFIVPAEVKEPDPKSDPKLHGNAWMPWQ